MVPVEWVKADPPWIAADPSGTDGAEGRVLFTRALRKRNFSGFHFWVACPPELCSQVLARAQGFADTAGLTREIALADYGPEGIGFFRERQWLPERPVTFPGKRDFKRLFLGADPAEHALLGEVEHWTQIRVQPGLPLTLTAPSTSALMESNGSFCHSNAYGFLTSHPGFAGTGLQIECGLHLPALAALRRMPQVQQALNAMGFEIHPLSVRTPGSAESGFFRVVTRGGMKFSEENFYRRFVEQVKSVLATENEAMKQWKEQEKERLEDRVYRSLRLLQEARTLDYAEFLAFASFARIGVYLGYFGGALLSRLENLRVRMQPFHMAAIRNGMKANEADIFRANVVRSELEGLTL